MKLTPDNIAHYWCIGTDCSPHITVQWVSDCREYVLIKHEGHGSEGRFFAARDYCPVSRSLVCLVGLDVRNVRVGNGAICRFSGRFTKKTRSVMYNRIYNHRLHRPDKQ